MGTPRLRRATEEDSAALTAFVPGLVPSATDAHHATFVIDGAGGPIALLDLLQTPTYLELRHLHASDDADARVLRDFADEAARGLKVREIRLAAGAMSEERAAALGYRNGVRQVAPVPLWRDGTASLSQSLYRRGVWAALALLLSIGSVSIAVFAGGELTLAHVLVPATLCAAGSLFAVWQIGLIVVAARRTSHLAVFALCGVVALVTVGLIGLLLQERALPALTELWAIRAGDTALGELEVGVSVDGRRLKVSGAYGMHSEEAVVRAIDRHPTVREVVLEGPGGRASVGFALFKLFRERKLGTHVDSACASACTIAFLGGVQRTVSPSGRLGFHRASFPGMGDDDMNDANRGMRNFMIQDARLTPSFARRVVETPADSIWVPTRDELLAGRAITR